MIKKEIKVLGDIYGSGIYVFCDDKGDIKYVGSSIEINNRLSTHKQNLQKGKYKENNKSVIQGLYDAGLLTFKVIKIVKTLDELRQMNNEEKKILLDVLAELEEHYIKIYSKEYKLCNIHKHITKASSNRDNDTTIKRRNSNLGTKNPNVKFSEELIRNIIWFKQQGYKPSKILDILVDKGINIKAPYLSLIGVTKWVQCNNRGLEPLWYTRKVS